MDGNMVLPTVVGVFLGKDVFTVQYTYVFISETTLANYGRIYEKRRDEARGCLS